MDFIELINLLEPLTPYLPLLLNYNYCIPKRKRDVLITLPEAAFCSKCELTYHDINLYRIAKRLENGEWINFICEGCNRRCIYRDEKGVLYLGVRQGSNIVLHPIKLKDLLCRFRSNFGLAKK